MCSVLRSVLALRLPGLQRCEVLEGGVRPLESLAVGTDEERDLVLAFTVFLARRYLFREEVDSELRHPLPHGGRVRAPLGLVERQHRAMLDAGSSA